MQSSIFSWFSRQFRKLNLWFNASITGKVFNRLSATLALAFSHSFLGGLFRPGTKNLFSGSLFHKLLTLPLNLCRKHQEKTGEFWHSVTSSSAVVWFFSNWSFISSRAYGMVLLTFTLSYGIIRMFYDLPGTLEWCLLAGGALFSLLLILVNRSLKGLFKGSICLTAFGGLFCKIKQDSESKLFLKDAEFPLEHPLVSALIGIFAGILANCMPLLPFCLLTFGFCYVCLVFQFPIVGVFTVIMASPILPTMVLTGGALLTVFAFFTKLATSDKITIRPVPLGGYVAFFVLALCLGTIFSMTFIKSAQILLITLSFVLFFYVTFQLLDTEIKWRSALLSFLFVGAFVGLYGIYQNFAGVSSTASWVDKEMFNNIKVRVYSTFDNPNVLGEFLVMMIPLSLAVIWKSKTHGQKFLCTALFFCLGACMIFTWSRGAWLGMMLATVLFLLIMDKRWWALVVIGLLMVPVLLGTDNPIADRILSIGNTKDTSTAYRVSIWQASLHMIRDFGVSGIGMGSDAFSMIYPRYALAGANFALHSHNLFLQILVESGIVGIVSFLAMVIAFVRRSFSLAVYQKRSKFSSALCIAICAGVLGFLFQGLTDNVWYNYKMVLIFWIMLAFASSASAPDFDGGEDK